jgi:phosphohistidine phosphatase
MHLLVVRHAIAEERRPDLDDADRELTREGMRKAKEAFAGLKRLGVSIDIVLSSPWKRALHTAAILAPLAKARPIATPLLCDSPTPALLAQISEHNVDTLAVVGHEPWLGELVAWLAFGDPKLGDQIELKKAAVARLEGTSAPGGMKLRALLPPGVLRELT